MSLGGEEFRKKVMSCVEEGDEVQKKIILYSTSDKLRFGPF